MAVAWCCLSLRHAVEVLDTISPFCNPLPEFMTSFKVIKRHKIAGILQNKNVIMS